MPHLLLVDDDDLSSLSELAYVGAEFDRMVEALHRSAAEIRHTAEDNAHAFKTPIAVIRQSLEPLRRALAEDNPRAQRAIGVVQHSLDRLNGLAASRSAPPAPGNDAGLFHVLSSTRRALILALGTYGTEGLSAAESAPAIARLLDLYENDPDAGVRQAVCHVRP